MEISNVMTFEEKDVSAEKRGNYVICVLGCDRIGLQTSYLFAKAGYQVIGVDINHDVKSLRGSGLFVTTDKNLTILLREQLQKGNFTLSQDPRKHIPVSDIIIFNFTTPFDLKKKPDYLRFETLCRDVGVSLRTGSLIIVEGAMAPGITETLIRDSLEDASGLQAGNDFGLAYASINPQRVFQDGATRPVIVGGINKQSLKVASLVLSTIAKVGEDNGSIN